MNRIDKISEADICEAFIGKATRAGWVAYPETSSWDILLVHSEKELDGTKLQLGIQAKLIFNTHVLHQALSGVMRDSRSNGPHYRGVLVPKYQLENQYITDRLQLALFARPMVRDDSGMVGIELLRTPELMHLWPAKKTSWVPDTVPDTRAGSSAPVQLTAWKQKALRLIALATVRGAVTSVDAKLLKIDLGIFIKSGWLAECGKIGRLNQYRLVEPGDRRRPDHQHPASFAHYLAEAKEQQEARQ